jgi:NADH-quinone oxidoreductase subunit C
MEIEKVIDGLKNKFPDKIKDVSSLFGDEIISIDKDSLLEIAEFLKKKPYEFTMLLDLTCVDYPPEAQRFEMVYHLFSISNNKRIRLKTRLSEDSLSIDSLTPLWKNANWLEREVFDMFGIEFLNHPDLRRLFMYDEFEGYPLRKDYPLRKEQPKINLRK